MSERRSQAEAAPWATRDLKEVMEFPRRTAVALARTVTDDDTNLKVIPSLPSPSTTTRRKCRSLHWHFKFDLFKLYWQCQCNVRVPDRAALSPLASVTVCLNLKDCHWQSVLTRTSVTQFALKIAYGSCGSGT